MPMFELLKGGFIVLNLFSKLPFRYLFVCLTELLILFTFKITFKLSSFLIRLQCSCTFNKAKKSLYYGSCVILKPQKCFITIKKINFVPCFTFFNYYYPDSIDKYYLQVALIFILQGDIKTFINTDKNAFSKTEFVLIILLIMLFICFFLDENELRHLHQIARMYKFLF